MAHRYRIRQVGNEYYPQERLGIAWFDIYIRTCSINRFKDRVDTIGNKLSCIYAENLDDCQRFLSDYDDNYLDSFIYKGHHIETMYDVALRKFVYVDLRNPSLYSESSADIYLKIEAYEDAQNKAKAKKKKEKKAAKQVTIHEYRKD